MKDFHIKYISNMSYFDSAGKILPKINVFKGNFSRPPFSAKMRKGHWWSLKAKPFFNIFQKCIMQGLNLKHPELYFLILDIYS